MIIKIKPEKIEFSKDIQKLCTKPYYNHPKGFDFNNGYNWCIRDFRKRLKKKLEVKT